MSTKDLSRTILEGGRAKSQRQYERFYTRAERCDARVACDRARFDTEADVTVDGRQRYWGKSFQDKTKPVARWVDRQVGRPWAEVYSELRTKFDVRTTAGRHVIYDHILSDIAGSPVRSFRGDLCHYVIDEDDILREQGHGWEWKNGRQHRLRRRERERKIRSPEEIREFLHERRVMFFGDTPYWVEPTKKTIIKWERCHGSDGCRESGWLHEKQDVRRYAYRTGKEEITSELHHRITLRRYRQGSPLTEREAAFWRSLTSEQQERHFYERRA